MDLSTGFVMYVSDESPSGSQNTFTAHRKVSNRIPFPAGWLRAAASVARQRPTLKAKGQVLLRDAKA